MSKLVNLLLVLIFSFQSSYGVVLSNKIKIISYKTSQSVQDGLDLVSIFHDKQDISQFVQRENILDEKKGNQESYSNSPKRQKIQDKPKQNKRKRKRKRKDSSLGEISLKDLDIFRDIGFNANMILRESFPKEYKKMIQTYYNFCFKECYFNNILWEDLPEPQKSIFYSMGVNSILEKVIEYKNHQNKETIKFNRQKLLDLLYINRESEHNLMGILNILDDSWTENFISDSKQFEKLLDLLYSNRESGESLTDILYILNICIHTNCIANSQQFEKLLDLLYINIYINRESEKNSHALFDVLTTCVDNELIVNSTQFEKLLDLLYSNRQSGKSLNYILHILNNSQQFEKLLDLLYINKESEANLIAIVEILDNSWTENLISDSKQFEKLLDLLYINRESEKISHYLFSLLTTCIDHELIVNSTQFEKLLDLLYINRDSEDNLSAMLDMLHNSLTKNLISNSKQFEKLLDLLYINRDSEDNLSAMLDMLHNSLTKNLISNSKQFEKLLDILQEMHKTYKDNFVELSRRINLMFNIIRDSLITDINKLVLLNTLSIIERNKLRIYLDCSINKLKVIEILKTGKVQGLSHLKTECIHGISLETLASIFLLHDYPREQIIKNYEKIIKGLDIFEQKGLENLQLISTDYKLLNFRNLSIGCLTTEEMKYFIKQFFYYNDRIRKTGNVTDSIKKETSSEILCNALKDIPDSELYISINGKLFSYVDEIIKTIKEFKIFRFDVLVKKIGFCTDDLFMLDLRFKILSLLEYNRPVLVGLSGDFVEWLKFIWMGLRAYEHIANELLLQTGEVIYLNDNRIRCIVHLKELLVKMILLTATNEDIAILRKNESRTGFFQKLHNILEGGCMAMFGADVGRLVNEYTSQKYQKAYKHVEDHQPVIYPNGWQIPAFSIKVQSHVLQKFYKTISNLFSMTQNPKIDLGARVVLTPEYVVNIEQDKVTLQDLPKDIDEQIKALLKFRQENFDKHPGFETIDISIMQASANNSFRVRALGALVENIVLFKTFLRINYSACIDSIRDITEIRAFLSRHLKEMLGYEKLRAIFDNQKVTYENMSIEMHTLLCI
ncbi:hypothetical protein ACFL4A_02940 [bacterium]